MKFYQIKLEFKNYGIVFFMGRYNDVLEDILLGYKK